MPGGSTTRRRLMPSAPRWAAGRKRRGTPGWPRRAASRTWATRAASCARRSRRSISGRSAPSRSTTSRAITATAASTRRRRCSRNAGWRLERPTGDTLFVEDFVYQWGLQEEYSIAANYARDPARKDRGFAACNWLALNRDIPSGTRDLARHNLRFYVEPAAKLLPSFTARPVGFTPPEGWHPMNPSVARRGDEIVMVQRTVNFVLEGGEYRTPGDGPVETRNFLLRLDAALAVTSSVEILPPADLPAACLRAGAGL